MNEFEKLLNTPFSALTKQGTPACFENEVIIDNRIDDDSKVIIDTFNRLLKDIFSPTMSDSVDISLNYAKSTTYDFSSLISSLSKVFEREMNNSIVQWVRAIEGIEMPDYYNKVKEGVEVRIESRNISIDINRKYNGQLATLPIGNILDIFRYIEDNIKPIAGAPKEISRLFSEYKMFLEELRKDRNAASHTGVMDEDSFVNFYKGYCEMVDKGWFTELMNLKEEMSNMNS